MCRVGEEIFRRVAHGILVNYGFTPEAILVFVHGLVSESVSQLSAKPRPVTPATPGAESTSSSRRPVDSRLIAVEPGRSKPKPTTQTNVAAHTITEFGLQVYIYMYSGTPLRTSLN